MDTDQDPLKISASPKDQKQRGEPSDVFSQGSPPAPRTRSRFAIVEKSQTLCHQLENSPSQSSRPYETPQKLLDPSSPLVPAPLFAINKRSPPAASATQSVLNFPSNKPAIPDLQQTLRTSVESTSAATGAKAFVEYAQPLPPDPLAAYNREVAHARLVGELPQIASLPQKALLPRKATLLTFGPPSPRARPLRREWIQAGLLSREDLQPEIDVESNMSSSTSLEDPAPPNPKMSFLHPESAAAITEHRREAIRLAKAQEKLVIEKCKRGNQDVPGYLFDELIGKGSFGRVYKG